jgi:ankyrin repeat protein
VKTGADVNVVAPGWEELTPLHLAIERGMDGVAVQLLAAGADKDATNSSSESALHFAVRHNRIAVVKDLAELGADTSVVNCCFETPLMFALFKKFDAAVALLQLDGVGPAPLVADPQPAPSGEPRRTRKTPRSGE